MFKRRCFHFPSQPSNIAFLKIEALSTTFFTYVPVNDRQPIMIKIIKHFSCQLRSFFYPPILYQPFPVFSSSIHDKLLNYLLLKMIDNHWSMQWIKAFFDIN